MNNIINSTISNNSTNNFHNLEKYTDEVERCQVVIDKLDAMINILDKYTGK